MLKLGTVNLTKISSFRNGDKYEKQTLDEDEGIVILRNNIPLSQCHHNYNQNNSHAFPKEFKISINDAYIFCCTKYFLSDSLTWAISEGKRSCILITDVELYIDRITKFHNDDLIFKGAMECIYSGNTIEASNALPYGTPQDLISNNLLAAFFKPIEYQQQRELRLLWLPKKNKDDREFIRNNIDIKDLLIPIVFDNFDESFQPSQNHCVGVRVIKNSSDVNAEFTVSTPNDVFTPVIFEEDGFKMLGFLIPSRNIGKVCVSGCRSGMLILGSRILICSIELNDVKQIEFFTNDV